MKERIKKYLKSIKPELLGLKGRLIVKSIKNLGQGTSNFNYLINVNGKKFVFRINAEPKNPGKSRKEFEGLKLIEPLGIGPKPRVLEENRKYFGSDFLIIDYLEGKTINKTSIYMKDEMIKGIARLLAKTHSVRITSEMKKKLSINENNPATIMSKPIKRYLRYIKKHVDNQNFLCMIKDSLSQAKKSFDNASKTKDLVLSQGDFCEQNIIYNKGTFKLIDFEDLELTDPIEQIAHIVIDFGTPFNENQKKLFFTEYLKIRKEKNLSVRVNNLIPLLYLTIFLWSIQRTLMVKNKEFHKEYLKKNDIKRDLEYAEIMFKRNLGFGNIPKEYSGMNMKKVLGL